MAGERSMSAPTSLQARVERYLVERRRLGFSGRNQACSLAQLRAPCPGRRPSRTVDGRGHGRVGASRQPWQQ